MEKTSLRLVASAVAIAAASSVPARAQTAGPGSAQAAPAETPSNTDASRPKQGAMDDIVVTARRRAENIQHVPLSIAAFNQTTLTQNAVASATDLGRVAPGLLAVPGSGLPTNIQFSIRGRGLNFGAAAGSVETYFAEVPLSSNFTMPQLPPQFFDVQSVQVLKGPQGTLFGRSTTGGAVLIQPAAPTDDWEGYGRVQLGDYHDVQAEGAVNIPVAKDVLAVRVAGFYWKRDGFTTLSPTLPDSVTSRLSDPTYLSSVFGAGTTFAGGQVRAADGRLMVDNGQVISSKTGLPLQKERYNNQNNVDLRATIRFTPGEKFKNDTILTYHRDRDIGGSAGNLALVRNAVGAPVGTIQGPGYGTYTGFLSYEPNLPPSHAYGIINTSSYALTDSLKLRNIFGYIDAKGYTLDNYDSDGGPARTIDVFAQHRPRQSRQFTDEVQLQGTALDDRLQFTAGGLIDLLREPQNADKLNPASSQANSSETDPAHPDALAFLTRYLSTNTTSRALYGSLTYKLTDRLSLTGGYRHTWDKVSATQADSESASIYQPEVFLDADPDVAGFQRTRALRAKFQGNIYNAGIDFQATQNILLYAGYRHGFKRGGFNSSAVGDFPTAFGPEQIDSFSVGAKTQFDVSSAIKARFNIEGFYDKYKGFQASYLSFDVGTAAVITITDNIPKVRYAGFDLDFGLSFSDWLDADLSYSYLDAKIVRYPDVTAGAVLQDGLEKNLVPYASKHQLQASLRFHGKQEGVGEWVLRPSVSYRSRYITTLFNRVEPAAQAGLLGPFNNIALGGAIVPGVVLVDLRFELNKVAGSNFGVAIGATNLLNKYYYVGNTGTLSFGSQGNTPGAPRMAYGEVSYRF